MQQYLQLRSVMVTASYASAAYMQAVGGWTQRQEVAQLRTGSSRLAVETGRIRFQGDVEVPLAERVCQRSAGAAAQL